MPRPLSGSQIAGRHSRRHSADSSPSLHSGQPPAARETRSQCSAQTVGAANPPKPRALATLVAPSVATASRGKQPLHQANAAEVL
eukprot:12306573-Alexandrium_andersonii.AAC.1